MNAQYSVLRGGGFGSIGAVADLAAIGVMEGGRSLCVSGFASCLVWASTRAACARHGGGRSGFGFGHPSARTLVVEPITEVPT